MIDAGALSGCGYAEYIIIMVISNQTQDSV